MRSAQRVLTHVADVANNVGDRSADDVTLPVRAPFGWRRDSICAGDSVPNVVRPAE